jgi:hypothetical protein
MSREKGKREREGGREGERQKHRKTVSCGEIDMNLRVLKYPATLFMTTLRILMHKVIEVPPSGLSVIPLFACITLTVVITCH